jgi:hypothetical protein
LGHVAGVFGFERVIGPSADVASELSEDVGQLCFEVVGCGRCDVVLAKSVDEVDELLELGEQLVGEGEFVRGGGCHEEGKERRVSHGGGLS